LLTIDIDELLVSIGIRNWGFYIENVGLGINVLVLLVLVTNYTVQKLSHSLLLSDAYECPKNKKHLARKKI